jgi:Transposase
MHKNKICSPAIYTSMGSDNHIASLPPFQQNGWRRVRVRTDAQEAGMNKFCGIDLHSNNSVVVVSDEADRVVYQRRLPNDAAQIRAALALQREDLVGVVVEATFNWYWLVDELMNDGYCVHLANPAAIRQYDGLKYSMVQKARILVNSRRAESSPAYKVCGPAFVL